MMNSKNNYVVLVPGCLVYPELQAKSSNISWTEPFRQVLTDNNIRIVAMPCPEATFNNVSCGIGRKPHSLQFYDNLPGFRHHSEILSEQVIQQIIDLNNSGNKVIAILGIEHSPTCAVNYIYVGNTTYRGEKVIVHCSGIFMEKIKEKLTTQQIPLMVIGINKAHPGKAITQLQSQIDNR